MIYIFLFIYTLFYFFIFIPLFCIASLWNAKMREGLRGRLTQCKKINEFAQKYKNDTIIFFHSASVGEWEQSIPIIKELKKNYPNIRILASFFSPSGMRHAKKDDVDCAIYLPFDIFFTALFFFKRIQPKLWIISKYDIWPGFLLAAHIQKVPVILSSAELAKDSTRYKGIFAFFNRTFYSYIQYILPVSEDYRERFLHIFPYPERLTVVGDARYDQIISKAELIQQEPSIQIFTNPRPITFIGGSLWPADEKHLFPALIKLYKETPDLQLILVPHELHESHISAIEQTFFENGITTERYSDFSKKGTTDCNVAIINTIGMLAKLYKTTDIAYVGGAFSTGVHNVAEPSVFGNPVVFGPKHINSYEAIKIRELQGGYSISNTEECYSIISKFILDEPFRKQTGSIAQNFIASNKGATQLICKKIEEFL